MITDCWPGRYGQRASPPTPNIFLALPSIFLLGLKLTPTMHNMFLEEYSMMSGVYRRVALRSTQVRQPSAGVELAVGGLDLVWELWVRAWFDDENIDPVDGLRFLLRDPADGHGVARVPGLEDVERDRGLAALALNEVGL